MMAIRISGTFVPPIVKAKTSLGFGHGTVVDIRTVMYESRKQLKMKVSLRRKIHIMALPQETFLNARWSEDKSAAMPRQPAGRVDWLLRCLSAHVSAISFRSVHLIPQIVSKVPRLSLSRQQQAKQDQPDQRAGSASRWCTTRRSSAPGPRRTAPRFGCGTAAEPPGRPTRAARAAAVIR